MFLATTNLTKFWNLNDDLLLLGDWCATNNSKILKSCNYKILPYPWKDINEKHRAYKYCKNVYEKLFPQVVQYLNEINGWGRSFFDLSATILIIKKFLNDGRSLKMINCL